MPKTFDICIRGDGVVGRTLALLLARDRLRIALVTRPIQIDQPAQLIQLTQDIAAHTPAAASSPTTMPAQADVRAYAINPASRALLQSLRSWPDAAHATAVLGMQVHGDDGGTVSFSAGDQATEALAWIVDVPALELQLAEAVRYQPLVELVDMPQPALLTVVCEGKSGQTQNALGAQTRTTRYSQHAIAARVECAQPHGGLARQWFLPDGVLAFLPMGGAAGQSVAVVWSVISSKLPELMALSPALFCERLATASGTAPGALLLTSERAVWPLQLASASHWCGSMPTLPAAASISTKPPPARSWVLAGDAAHTVHPLAGQGLNLGLADAAALAQVLHERDYWRSVADLRLLRRYERARKASVLAMGMTTDGLQQLFMRDDGPWQALRNWGMRGFQQSGPVKRWVAQQAMGIR